VPCPKGCSAEDIVERLKSANDIRAWDTGNDADNRRNKVIADAADLITNMRAYISDLEQREKDARAKALEDAAQAGYVTCAKTRHVSLGDQVAAAIRALQEGR
jgi:hypothetical protein